MSLSMRRVAFVVVSSALPLLAGCPKKATPVVDAGPMVAAPVEDAAPTVLMPMEEDAGWDAGYDAGKKAMGPAVNPNVARLKQCCAALATQGKSLGNSPEGAMITAASAQCTTMALQAGPTGTAPELGTLRTILAGRAVPAVCAGF